MEAKDLNFEVKSLESGLKSFQIVIPVEDVNNELKNCYKSLRQEMTIPGFRKGRAPIGILRTRYANYIRGELFREMIHPACQEAMDSAEVVSLGEIDFVPELEKIEIKDNQPITFEMIVPVKPEINLPEYDELQIDKSGEDVPEEEVDKFIKNLREQNAEFLPIEEDRSIREDDFVKFDWKYYENDESTAEGEDDLVMIPQENPETISSQYRFARELIGSEIGEEKEIELDFEDDYPDSNFAGKNIKYHVTLNAITEKVLPNLDDEFAKKAGYENHDQMRGNIWNTLVENRKRLLNQKQRQEIVEELLEKTDLNVPDSVVQQHAESLAEGMKRGLRRERKSSREIDAEIESKREQLNLRALRDIKQMWIFDEIAERENISITDKELDLQVSALAQQKNRDPRQYAEMLKASKQIDGIRQRLIDEKLFSFLIERASAKQKIIV